MSTVHTPPNPSESKPAPEESAGAIDTSKMSAGQRAALELTEAAREAVSEKGGFVAGLFMGRCDLSQVFPYPAQSAEDRQKGELFLKRLEQFLREHVDPDEIDRTGEIPEEV